MSSSISTQSQNSKIFKVVFVPNFFVKSKKFVEYIELPLEVVTVEDLVSKSLELGWLADEIQYILFINGVEVQDPDFVISLNDEIIFKIRPQKKLKNVLRFILPLVLGNIFAKGFAKVLFGTSKLSSLSSFKEGIAGLLGTFAASVVANKLAPPTQQDIGGRPSQSSDTPMYTLTSTRNNVNAYGPIPIVYGDIRVYPPYATKPYTETAGKDQYVYGVLAVGFVPNGDDTKLVVDDIRIGETAISNFQGVSYNAFTSVQRMTAGAKAKYNANVDEELFEVHLTQTAGWITKTTAVDTDILSIDLTAPNGLIRYDTAGNKFAETVKFEAQIKKTSEPITAWKNLELQRLTDVFGSISIDFSITNVVYGTYLIVSGGISAYSGEDGNIVFVDNYSSFSDRITGFKGAYDPFSGKIISPALNVQYVLPDLQALTYLRSFDLKNSNVSNFPQISALGSFNTGYLYRPYPFSFIARGCFHYYTLLQSSMQWIYLREDRYTAYGTVNNTTGVLSHIGTYTFPIDFSALVFPPADFNVSFAACEGATLALCKSGSDFLVFAMSGNMFDGIPSSELARYAISNPNGLELPEGNHNLFFEQDYIPSSTRVRFGFFAKFPTDQTLYVYSVDVEEGAGTVIVGYSNGAFVTHSPLNPFPDSSDIHYSINPTCSPANYINTNKIYIICKDMDSLSPTFGQALIYLYDVASHGYTLFGSPPVGDNYEKYYNLAFSGTEAYAAFVPERAKHAVDTSPLYKLQASSQIVFTPSENDLVDYILNAKSDQPVRWSFFADPLETDQYDIRIRRVTLDTSDQYKRNDIYWTTLRSFQAGDAIVTPNVKTLSFRLKATDQLSGAVDSLNCRVRSILRVWDGANFSYELTNNPAWILADILTGGASKKPIPDGRIDWNKLKEWADFCDDKGFTCNIVVDNYTTQLQLLQDVASTGRASYDMVDSLHTVVIDKERDTPVQLLTPRNTWNFSSEKVFVEKPHAIRVGFRNEEKDFDRDERIVYNDGYDENNASVFENMDFWGVTNPDHAYKLARYYLAVAQLRPEIFRVNADIENIILTKGDLFLYQDDVISWGLGTTRIKNLETIISDQVITLEGTLDLDITANYACRVRDEGMAIYVFTVTPYTYESGVGDIRTTSAVKVVTGANFADLEVGNLIALGTVSQGAAIECLVSEINYSEELVAEIVFTEYNDAVYSADTEVIPPFDSKITQTLTARRGTPEVPIISGIISDESALYRNDTGTLVPRIIVRFQPIPRTEPNYPDGVRAIWRDIEDISGTWQTQTFQLNSEFQVALPDVEEGKQYWGSFQYITKEGIAGAWISYSAADAAGFGYNTPHTVIGKSTPPGDVDNFTANFRDYAIELSWDQNLDPDLDVYEIRLGNTWDSGTLVTLNKTTTYVDDVRAIGNFNYMIRALDTSGHYSENTTSVSIAVLAPGTPSISHVFDNLGNAILSWSASMNTFFVDQYEIRFGTTLDTWDTATFLLTTKARKYSERINYGGTRRYFFKSIDIGGNFSDAVYHDVVITPPPAVTSLGAQAIRSQVVLTWQSTQGSLPIRYYNIYKGTSVLLGTKLASADATIAQITEIEPSNPVYRYWVTAVDTAGNESDGAMTEVAVSPQSDYTFIGTQISDMRYPDSKSNYFITVLESLEKVGFPMIDETDTFQEHFTNNAYTSPQDQIDLGFDYYLEPTNLTAQYIETVDMLNGSGEEDAVLVNGTVLLNTSPSGYAKVTIDSAITENVTLRAGISTVSIISGASYSGSYSADGKVTRVLLSELTYSPSKGEFVIARTSSGIRTCRVIDNDGTYIYYTHHTKDYSWATPISGGFFEVGTVKLHSISWTTTSSGQYNIFATNFRFLQVEINWENPPNTGNNLTYYKGFFISTSAEPLDDGGVADILASDVGGTYIEYNQTFLQVLSVTGNAVSTSQPYFLTFDFDDSELNPEGFYAYGWDVSGSRVSIQIAWRARGI